MRLSEVQERLRGEKDQQPARLLTLADESNAAFRRGVKAPRRVQDGPLRAVVEHLVQAPATLSEVERAAIEAALVVANDNVSQACKLLEVGRTTLYRKMKRYGLGR
jgi:transcriptional regulator of acetoin/glycerol metabolism